jgi:D-lactate dehydrogenase
MRVCFVGVESEEEAYFARRLEKWAPGFVNELTMVPEDAEVVSVFIEERVEAGFLDGHPALRLVATRSTGYEHVDIAACKARDVQVAHVREYGENSVAEHTFALLLAVTRRLFEAAEIRVKGGFSRTALRGIDLRGKTMGLIGAGRVGLRVVALAKAFGMHVLVTDPRPYPFYAELMGFEYRTLDEVLATSDVISLHTALTPETEHLLNAERLAKCHPGVIIINTARGGLIDTAALAAAIGQGQVAGAGLDVLEDEAVLRREAKSIVASQIAERVHASNPQEQRYLSEERVRQIQALYSQSALLARPEVVFTASYRIQYGGSAGANQLDHCREHRRLSGREAIVERCRCLRKAITGW